MVINVFASFVFSEFHIPCNWKVHNLNYTIAFLGLIADVSLYLQFVSFMLLKHSIVTVARSKSEKEREMVYFCLRNDSGREQRNQYLYRVSINFSFSYLFAILKSTQYKKLTPKCFAVHILKFEILQNIKMLDLLVKNWKLKLMFFVSF